MIHKSVMYKRLTWLTSNCLIKYKCLREKNHHELLKIDKNNVIKVS